MNSVAYFEIQSSNPVREMHFYSTIFNWRFIKEDLVSDEYFRIDANGIYGGLLKRMEPVPPANCGTNAFTCSIQVSNFDASAKVILENGGQIKVPKFAVPGRCWQGYFLDEDRNTFGIFEVEPEAK
jgi:predicted enzyme related to lactoylglutathione lyase